MGVFKKQREDKKGMRLSDLLNPVPFGPTYFGYLETRVSPSPWYK